MSCWLADQKLADWERRLLAAVQQPRRRRGQMCWDLDRTPPATLAALSWPRQSVPPARLARATGTAGA